jgi:hypothetical protein
MSYLKDLAIFCANEGLDFENFGARRAFETGATSISIRDDRPLTLDDIDALTGRLIGTITVQCPYCGVPGKFNMKIERPSLGYAKWFCHYCGHAGEVRAGGPVDPEKEAEARRRSTELKKEEQAHKQARALGIWDVCVPIRDGDPVRRYLNARGIFDLPPKVDEVLRFHPQCPFGLETRACLVGLMRDVLTDEPRAIHRIAITDRGEAQGKWNLGPRARAAVKLWPLTGDTLVIGEGVETVLAAATRLKWREPLRPAWALTVASNLGEVWRNGRINTLPVIEAVKRLRILVDNDENGVGPRAANLCAAAWQRAGREVFLLTPKEKGADFNDLVRGAAR